ncbi:MAG: Transcriptional regulator [uncultured Caballeronia sp.]|nr:MAG: Transcriptional regulator [uncultured Caballeronia sp.]
MNILFPADAPEYRDTNLIVVFAALVDGERVPCAISVEALEDHFFGVESFDSSGWIRAFDAARPAIEAVAREHLSISQGAPVLLKSGHFPPGLVS